MEASSKTALKRKQLFQGLLEAAHSKKLGHALIFNTHSEDSAEFKNFVSDFMRALLCSQPKIAAACGNCDSCRLILASTNGEPVAHPDAFCLRTEGVKGYSIEQTRELVGAFYLKNSLSPNRVCWIQSADRLSLSGAQSANSLLKLIEEPRPNSFVLLTTENLSTMLPTIRSRCQTFQVPVDAALDDSMEDVQSLAAWIAEGGKMPDDLGPDHTVFFEEREEALKNLRILSQGLWAQVKADMGSFSRTKAYFVLEFLQAIEVFAQSMTFYASPGLGWSEIRIRFGKCPSS